LFRALSNKSSQVRFLSLQACNQLFTRSSLFRRLLSSNFTEFTSLTIQTKHNPLPPPEHLSRLLHEQTLEYIEQWNEKFGKFLPSLASGYEDLKTSGIEFPSTRREILIKENERKQRILEAQISQILKQGRSVLEEIDEILEQMENSFEILVPSDPFSDLLEEPEENKRDDMSKPPTSATPEDHSELLSFFDSLGPDLEDHTAIPEDWNCEEDDPLFDMQDQYRSYGLLDSGYEIEIEIEKDVSVSTENSATETLVDVLSDSNQLLNNRFLPLLRKWESILSSPIPVNKEQVHFCNFQFCFLHCSNPNAPSHHSKRKN